LHRRLPNSRQSEIPDIEIVTLRHHMWFNSKSRKEQAAYGYRESRCIQLPV
jgi:hypothetical protein